MQALTAPPQMTSPYTPAGGSGMSTGPTLGPQIPGTTGGLPAQPGLSVASNPMAKQLQELQKENSRLKKLVADQALDMLILKEAARPN